MIPSSLKNSCLIYKTSNENFFHGFNVVGENGFAKVFTSEYIQSNKVIKKKLINLFYSFIAALQVKAPILLYFV